MTTLKRWILTIDRFDHKPKIYAPTSEKAKDVFKGEIVTNVEPFTDFSYLNIISEMIAKSEMLACHKIKGHNVREWYKYKCNDGIVRFRLYKDTDDDLYYDITEYQFISNDRKLLPCTFVYSNPADTYNLFFVAPLTCEIPIYRFYGKPKMSKPSELKNVKQAFSAEWNKQCKCQCFVKDNDLWIKHGDFFSASHKPSPEDMGTPTIYRLKKYFGSTRSLKSFGYPDCWSEIILRNEAWIVFRNILPTIYKDQHPPIRSMVRVFLQSETMRNLKIYSLSNNEEWERFFEKVYKAYKETVFK